MHGLGLLKIVVGPPKIQTKSKYNYLLGRWHSPHHNLSKEPCQQKQEQPVKKDQVRSETIQRRRINPTQRRPTQKGVVVWMNHGILQWENRQLQVGLYRSLQVLQAKPVKSVGAVECNIGVVKSPDPAKTLWMETNGLNTKEQQLVGRSSNSNTPDPFYLNSYMMLPSIPAKDTSSIDSQLCFDSKTLGPLTM